MPDYRIRLATGDDAAAIAAIYAPFCEASVVTFETVPPTAVEMRSRLEATLPARPWLVSEAGTSIAGYAYAAPHRVRAAYQWCAESSVYIHTDHHRRGVGRALYHALFTLLRELGYHNVFAGVTLPNPASVRLHEAFGFEQIGIYRSAGFKQGVWHDVGWWQLALGEYSEEPTPPLAFADLLATRGTPRFEADGSARWPE